MVLNNLSQSFVIYFGMNYFYPEVNDHWLPVIKKMYLPYRTVEDFMNSQIQTITFPAIDMPAVTQGHWQYENYKRNGKTLDQLTQKDSTGNITFKLTESYISYFIMREQLDLYLKYYDIQELYFSPIAVSLLDDAGIETVSYRYVQVTPISLSELSLSYAARLGTYSTFSMSFRFNFFEILYRDLDTGKLELINKYKMINEQTERTISSTAKAHSEAESSYSGRATKIRIIG